ncbi:MAG: hypothetical protein M5U13_04975 [Thermoanaerobaculia bacterium]|nr:hypothetical protein [Thermoanaerobaculia bacterium]
MSAKNPLQTISNLLHAVSRLGFLFALIGIYYEIRAFAAMRWETPAGEAEFIENLVLSLTMWGFFMGLLSLSDNDRLKPKEIGKFQRNPRAVRTMVVFLVAAALLSVALGLYFLLGRRDELVGVALVTFAVGGLGVARLIRERLKYALSAPA